VVADLAVVEVGKRATNVARKATKGEIAHEQVRERIRIVPAAKENGPGHL